MFTCSGRRRRGSGGWSEVTVALETLVSVQPRTVCELVVPSALERLADTNPDCFSPKGCIALVLTVSPRLLARGLRSVEEMQNFQRVSL